MKYRKQLGKVIVVVSIILMVSLMLLCNELGIQPLFGIGAGFVFMITLILVLPNKLISHE